MVPYLFYKYALESDVVLNLSRCFGGFVTMINKTMMFYWGCNKPLSYMRYLSIRSFALLNPDWEVVVTVPNKPNMNNNFEWIKEGTKEQQSSNPTEEHLQLFITNKTKLPNITINVYDPNELMFGDADEIHRSDRYRYWWMFNNGGFYSDTDILYIKPMSVITDNIPDDAKAYLCPNKWQNYQPIGFLGCEKGSKTFEKTFKLSSEVIYKGYQSCGRYVLEEALAMNQEKTYDMPYESVYPVDNLGTLKLFNNKPLELKQSTIGIHWFGGDPVVGKFETEVTKETISDVSWRFLFNLMEKVK